LFYANKRLGLARQNDFKLAEAFAYVNIGYQYSKMGKYAEAFQNLLLSLEITEDPKNEEKKGWRTSQFPISGKERLSNLAMAHYNMGILMHLTENPKKEVFHLKEALKIGKQINHIERQMVSNMRLADAYLKMDKPDSALFFAKQADFFSKNPAFRGFYRGLNISYIGDTYFKKGEIKLAKKYYLEGLSLSTEKNLKAISLK
jgi:tetratricopeptide (TPR) repeat protein